MRVAVRVSTYICREAFFTRGDMVLSIPLSQRRQPLTSSQGTHTNYPLVSTPSHGVYRPLCRATQDAGVKAMITGLVSASAGYLLSSSFNASSSNICQKPHSKYIDLVAEWRLGLLGKDPLSMGELFPVFDEPPTFTLPSALVFFAAGLVLSVMIWAAQTQARERLKSS